MLTIESIDHCVLSPKQQARHNQCDDHLFIPIVDIVSIQAMASSGMLYIDGAQWREFRPTYQRNNKKGGHKNLRCFPNCCRGVHATTGFCGSPVTVHFQWMGVPPPRIQVLAHFSPLLVSGAPLWRTFDYGLPDPQDPSWYFGDCISVDADRMELTMSLNTVLKGWHYGWVSNRHTSETLHVLCIYAVVEAQDGVIECLHQIHTPPFRIFSRRRAKTIKSLHAHPERPPKLRRLLERTDSGASSSCSSACSQFDKIKLEATADNGEDKGADVISLVDLLMQVEDDDGDDGYN
ncbi:hypothetical protein AeNC1_000067 [Aphanomyces euteiches]|nr:hypothetical protein AeNC1_000067 [Aphanomyces euteiches]